MDFDSYEEIPDAECKKILGAYPKALDLLELGRNFFGHNLKVLRWDSAEKESACTLTSKLASDEAFVYVLLRETDHQDTDLTHELLHVKRWTEGHPNLFDMPRFTSDPEFETFIYAELGRNINGISHLTFIDEFASIGLPPCRFLARVEQCGVEDSLRVALEWRARSEAFARLLWGQFFLSVFLIHAQGFGILTPEEVLEAGQAEFPHLREVAKKASSWLERREFDDPASAPASIRELLDFINSPTIVLIRARSSNGRILAAYI